MNNRNEYLVKYSVAPPPSRDYYGLRIVQNEVIFYLWKISHGPHKAPIVHRAKFTEFDQQKLLQDEIRHGFGEHVLNHIRNIAEGNRNTLLILPISLIGRISRYLEYRDILKLSSLSRIAYEIFNADLIWEILYKRDKNAKIDVREREEAEVYGWKQLYKDREMQAFLMKDEKIQQFNVTNKNKNLIKTRDQHILEDLRMQSSIERTNDVKVNKSSLKTTNASKPSKTVSTVNIATKQHSEFSNSDLITIPLSKTSSDIRFRNPNMKTEKEKSLPLKKNLRNCNSGFSASNKSIKKEELIAPRIMTKRETRSVSKHGEGFTKQSKKPEKCIDKNNKVKATSQEDKTKYVTSKTSLVLKSTVGNVKSSSDLARGLHDKARSKTKVKPKKVAVTSSEIFNNDKTLSDNLFVGDNNFDLADLIEASLKNIRSPRSIFDYDFSCMQRTDVTGDASRVRHELLDVDMSKQLKFARSDVPNYFPGRIVRESEILEKLSERSEPYSETSTESIVKVISKKSDKLLSKKRTKIPVELRKSLNVRKSAEMFPKDREDSRASFRNKCFSPGKISNIDEKLSITRGPLRTSGSLKAHASNSLESKKGLLAKTTENLRSQKHIGEID